MRTGSELKTMNSEEIYRILDSLPLDEKYEVTKKLAMEFGIYMKPCKICETPVYPRSEEDFLCVGCLSPVCDECVTSVCCNNCHNYFCMLCAEDKECCLCMYT